MVRLLNGLNKGDTIDLGGGDTDQVALFQSATFGSIKATENVQILAGHDDNAAIAPFPSPANRAADNADTINFDTSIAADLKSIYIRNEGQDFVPNDTTATNWVSDSENATINLTKVSATVATAITVAHGTTGNNALALGANGAPGGTLVTVSAATDTANDTVGLTIVDGVNSNPRFNLQFQALKYENVTITDNDSESNTVQLGAGGVVAPHSGTITVTGGKAGNFLNLDATANALRLDTTGAATDGKGILNVATAAAERFSSAKIDASGFAGDLIVRVDTLRDSTGAELAGGGQQIKTGSGNDTVFFDQLNNTTAGLTILDTVALGAGNDTLAIDGENAKITIGASEWTNVSGVETIRLIGNNDALGFAAFNTATANGANDAFGRNAYNLLLTNELITANGEAVTGGRRINIISDNDPVNDEVGKADTPGTGFERGVTIDARTLTAQNGFTFNGEEGATQDADRFILSDANVNGFQIIDGGAIRTGATNTGSNAANADVLEVRNSAVVTVGDLANIKNIGTIEFTTDQAAVQQSFLTLDNATVEALVNSSKAASAGNTETLTIRAFDNPLLAAASHSLTLDATQVTSAFLNLIVTGAGGADVIKAGSGNDILTGGAGADILTVGQVPISSG